MKEKKSVQVIIFFGQYLSPLDTGVFAGYPLFLIVSQVKAGRSFFDLLDDDSGTAREEDVVGNLEKLLNHSLGKLNNHKVLGARLVLKN